MYIVRVELHSLVYIILHVHVYKVRCTYNFFTNYTTSCWHYKCTSAAVEQVNLEARTRSFLHAARLTVRRCPRLRRRRRRRRRSPALQTCFCAARPRRYCCRCRPRWSSSVPAPFLPALHVVAGLVVLIALSGRGSTCSRRGPMEGPDHAASAGAAVLLEVLRGTALFVRAYWYLLQPASR